MSHRETIPPANLNLKVFQLLEQRWMLLTAGTLETSNCMTVSWGTLGILWNKPIAVIFVRPSRHTFPFTEKYSDFTLTTLPAEFHDKLNYCGTHSGRTIDKATACNLTRIPSLKVAAPAYDEADLILECRKIYSADLDPHHFLAPEIEKNYNGRDYHRFYFGEILHAAGTSDYRPT